MKPEVKLENWWLEHHAGKYRGLTTFVLHGDAKGHPELGDEYVHTSQVLNINFETCVAETLNTRYLLGNHYND